MRCNNQHDQINAFAAGELNPIRAWQLRHHLRQCQSCSARLQRAQELAGGLAKLGEATPSDALRDRVYGELQFLASRAGVETERWHNLRHRRMNKARYAVAGVLAALAMTGVTAVQVQRLHRAGIFVDPYGQTWTLGGSFVGEAFIKNPQGQYIGAYRSESGDLMTGPVRFAMAYGDNSIYSGNEDTAVAGVLSIDVAGEHFEVQGAGNHDLRTAAGNLLGHVYLGWPGEQQKRIAYPMLLGRRSSRGRLILPNPVITPPASAAISVFPWGICGIDKPLHLTWQMFGPGKVQMLEPGQQPPLMTGETVPLKPDIRRKLEPDLVSIATRKSPEFIWLLGDHGGHAAGYGTHPLKDEHGRTVAILKVAPLP